MTTREKDDIQHREHLQPQSTSGSDDMVVEKPKVHSDSLATTLTVKQEEPKTAWWHPVKEPGSAVQIVIAAALAISIGLAVSSTVDEVPEAASAIIAIPGELWLRALRAVVLPLIVAAMILAVQSLKEMMGTGARLAKWTVGYYVGTTLIAIVHSVIAVALGWSRLMTEASAESLQIAAEDEGTISERQAVEIHQVVVDMFESFIPANIVNALATDSLLAVLITAIVVGALIKGPDSSLLRATKEVEKIITSIITFLVKLAPVGVFFLILPNLFRLNIADIGQNLGVLIAGSLVGMAVHLFIIIPIIFFAVTRKNPWAHWAKCSPAWTIAWGTASSAATLPVTLRVARARGVPEPVVKFALPLGCLINMDGTAIYFPVVVVFLAVTQGITLNAADYIIIVLLSTLASIGTTPIPSSSLVLTVMIAGSVNVPVTGMYAVVVAIDWFIDRFRTLMNVSCDLFAAPIVSKLSGFDKRCDDENAVAEHSEETEVAGDNSKRV